MYQKTISCLRMKKMQVRHIASFLKVSKWYKGINLLCKHGLVVEDTEHARLKKILKGK